MANRRVELFIAGCTVCESAIELVKSLTCESCELTIYDLSNADDVASCREKITSYQILSLPAVAVNGKLLTCCTNKGIDKNELIEAGVGERM